MFDAKQTDAGTTPTAGADNLPQCDHLYRSTAVVATEMGRKDDTQPPSRTTMVARSASGVRLRVYFFFQGTKKGESTTATATITFTATGGVPRMLLTSVREETL